MTSPNPSTSWDAVPVWGHFFKADDVTPQTGSVRFTLMQRVTRVDGRRIYPEGATVERTIGDLSADPATRDAVRAAWRAADEAAAAAAGQTFDGAAWDAWWNVSMTGAVFASFPASDDPDIVQTGYQVKVEERLTSGSGKTYFIEPVLAHLQTTPPGINLGLIEVPPGSPTVPAPIYAKGLPGGVAALDADGTVPLEQLPDGIGGSTDASQLTTGTLAADRIADGSLPVAKLAVDVATQAELDALTTATSTALADRATDAELTAETSARTSADTALDGRLDTVEAALPTKADTTSLAPVATSGSYDSLLDKPAIPATASEVGAQPYARRYWNGTGGVGTWDARPPLPASVHAESYSLLDALAPAPPGGLAGDTWDRAPGAT